MNENINPNLSQVKNAIKLILKIYSIVINKEPISFNQEEKFKIIKSKFILIEEKILSRIKNGSNQKIYFDAEKYNDLIPRIIEFYESLDFNIDGEDINQNLVINDYPEILNGEFLPEKILTELKKAVWVIGHIRDTFLHENESDNVKVIPDFLKQKIRFINDISFPKLILKCDINISDMYEFCDVVFEKKYDDFFNHELRNHLVRINEKNRGYSLGGFTSFNNDYYIHNLAFEIYEKYNKRIMLNDYISKEENDYIKYVYKNYLLKNYENYDLYNNFLDEIEQFDLPQLNFIMSIVYLIVNESEQKINRDIGIFATMLMEFATETIVKDKEKICDFLTNNSAFYLDFNYCEYAKEEQNNNTSTYVRNFLYKKVKGLKKSFSKNSRNLTLLEIYNNISIDTVKKTFLEECEKLFSDADCKLEQEIGKDNLQYSKNFIRRIRNAFAHARINILNNDGEICLFDGVNKLQDGEIVFDKDFELQVSIEKILSFLINLSLYRNLSVDNEKEMKKYKERFLQKCFGDLDDTESEETNILYDYFSALREYKELIKYISERS